VRATIERRGFDWALFARFVGAMAVNSELEDDFRATLERLDAECRTGNPVAQRYARLIAGEMGRPLREVDGESLLEVAIERITLVAALTFHWNSRPAEHECIVH
jgi:hypothetical protein